MIRKQGSPKGVPFEYVMQPLDIKLAYRNHPWCTVRLEVSHNELGDADTLDMRELPEEIKGISQTARGRNRNAYVRVGASPRKQGRAGCGRRDD